MTTLLSINWAIAAVPVMHGTFIINDDCLLNTTGSVEDINECMENSQTITPISEV